MTVCVVSAATCSLLLPSTGLSWCQCSLWPLPRWWGGVGRKWTFWSPKNSNSCPTGPNYSSGAVISALFGLGMALLPLFTTSSCRSVLERFGSGKRPAGCAVSQTKRTPFWLWPWLFPCQNHTNGCDVNATWIGSSETLDTLDNPGNIIKDISELDFYVFCFFLPLYPRFYHSISVLCNSLSFLIVPMTKVTCHAGWNAVLYLFCQASQKIRWKLRMQYLIFHPTYPQPGVLLSNQSMILSVFREN